MTTAVAPQPGNISERQIAALIAQLQAIQTVVQSGSFQVRACEDVLQAAHDRLVQNGIQGDQLGALVADLAPYTDYGNGVDAIVPGLRELYEAGAIHRHGLSAYEARRFADRIANEFLPAIDKGKEDAIPATAVTVHEEPSGPPSPFVPRPFPPPAPPQTPGA